MEEDNNVSFDRLINYAISFTGVLEDVIGVLSIKKKVFLTSKLKLLTFLCICVYICIHQIQLKSLFSRIGYQYSLSNKFAEIINNPETLFYLSKGIWHLQLYRHRYYTWEASTMYVCKKIPLRFRPAIRKKFPSKFIPINQVFSIYFICSQEH